MTRRHEITDEQWELVRDLLPQNEGVGRPWKDHHQILNGMFWILNSGAPWRDLPERYGPWQTVYDRFRRWEKDGTIDRILEALQIRLDQNGYIDWDLWCVDGSSVRAHKAAAGAPKKGMRRSPKATLWAAQEAVGAPRSTWYLTVTESPLRSKSRPGKRTNRRVSKM